VLQPQAFQAEDGTKRVLFDRQLSFWLRFEKLMARKHVVVQTEECPPHITKSGLQ